MLKAIENKIISYRQLPRSQGLATSGAGPIFVVWLMRGKCGFRLSPRNQTAGRVNSLGAVEDVRHIENIL